MTVDQSNSNVDRDETNSVNTSLIEKTDKETCLEHSKIAYYRKLILALLIWLTSVNFPDSIT